MKTILIAAAALTAAALTSPVQASDMLRTTEFYADETPVVENVRMVCNEWGRCWREPRRRTVVIEDSYNAPRERYIERREYYGGHREYHGGHRGPGIGIHAPGVNVDVGVGGRTW